MVSSAYADIASSHDSADTVLAWLLACGHVTVTMNLGNLLYEVQGVREKAGTVP